MIQAVELNLLNQFQTFWATLAANIGQTGDYIPLIFSTLPATGQYGANWEGIGKVFSSMSTGTNQNDLIFILQFPALKAQIPCVTIEVGQEQEIEVVGAFINQGVDPSTGQGYRHIGGPFIKSLAVGVFSFNPDSTLYLYSMIKYAVLQFRTLFGDQATIHVSSRPMGVEGEKFEVPVYFRYIDLVFDGVMDFAVQEYGVVSSVNVQSTDYINTINETATINDNIN